MGIVYNIIDPPFILTLSLTHVKALLPLTLTGWALSGYGH
jgi:hypothetical protein